MKALQVFKGLYGDNSYSPVFDFVHAEPLEVRSKRYDWEIQEHLHVDLVQVFVIEAGSGILTSEKSQIEVQGPCCIIIPSNTLHGFVFKDTIKGHVLTLADAFFETTFKTKANIFIDLNSLNYYQFEPDSSDFNTLLWQKNIVIEELNHQRVEKQAYLQALFLLFFIHIYGFHVGRKSQPRHTDNKTLQYFQAFQKAIKAGLADSKTVRQYADDIGISTMHLNRVCQTLVQKSPIQLIHENLLAESKKYLLNTTYTVSEVSYLLNFSDPAYFTKLFKKNVGVTPSEYRKT
jgi:AraC family transcriptional regulator, transcriptional activator of pobA